MKAVHKRRLLRVAEVLESVPRKEFDMTDFIRPECGTPACALGHYAASRNFRGPFKRTKLNGVRWEGDGSLFELATEHFGLSHDVWTGASEVFELFHVNGCNYATTPKQAAKYIRRFVARKERAEAA